MRLATLEMDSCVGVISTELVGAGNGEVLMRCSRIDGGVEVDCCWRVAYIIVVMGKLWRNGGVSALEGRY